MFGIDTVPAPVPLGHGLAFREIGQPIDPLKQRARGRRSDLSDFRETKR